MFIVRLAPVLVYVALIAGLFSGCAELQHQDQTKKLDQAVRAYIHAVRWGDMGAAASFIRPREGSVEPPDLSEFKGLRVTHYDGPAIDSKVKGHPEALMTVAFDYYFEETLSVKKVYQQAVWWWDPDVENWFMEGELPNFER